LSPVVLWFIAVVAALTDRTVVAKQTISGSNGAAISIEPSDAELIVTYRANDFRPGKDVLYVALSTHREIGSAVIPFQRHQEGSTVFLPFKADLLIFTGPEGCSQRKWEKWKWAGPEKSTATSNTGDGGIILKIPRDVLGSTKTVDCAIYAKDLSENDGWGRFLGGNDPAAPNGYGDVYLTRYLEIDLSARDDHIATNRARLNFADSKMRIYQLFVRLFGNTNETRKQNGTLAENGVGKFKDINEAALKSLRQSGFTHVWLTGLLQQATATDYSSIGQPADDPDLLKGLAGSPYAIKDYFDVCPDYAVDPKKRLEEFKELLNRIHAHGMKALIDFVPNHVARSYNSDVKPDQNFGLKGNGGAGDDMSVFFSPRNNFFYLTPGSDGPPLRLPTCKDGQPISPTCKAIANIGGTTSQNAGDLGIRAGSSSVSSPSMGRDRAHPSVCDGLFDGEKDHGKVTGNNQPSWTPGINDWYETVKLNYGFDFTKPDKSVREYPNANAPDKALPDTWNKMDSVLAYWQALGVDGFRCDMSHMVPPEFWNWAISRARSRHRDVVFIGEAYDNDPAKVPGVDPIISQLHGGKSNVMFDLLDAGFNAVYDDPTYRAIKKIYEGPGWANDIDGGRPDAFIFDNSLRYAENHDEVRLASKSQWGSVGMKVGVPVSAILYGLSNGPVMLYNGQEVGEPGAGREGFGDEDSRTTIFDYWSMPEMVKWVDGHKYDGGRLSNEQKDLRSFYGRLVNLLGERAFRGGESLPLNAANRDNVNYGRLPKEEASGHWLYSFVRYDPVSGQRFVVAVNLNPTTSLRDIQIKLPEAVLARIGLMTPDRGATISVKDRLNAAPLVDAQLNAGYLRDSGLPIAEIPPLTACYLEIKL
jgi:glycosidase